MTVLDSEGWEWCDTCMEPRAVDEVHYEVVTERYSQRGVRVTRYSCGHEKVVNDGTFYSL